MGCGSDNAARGEQVAGDAPLSRPDFPLNEGFLYATVQAVVIPLNYMR